MVLINFSFGNKARYLVPVLAVFLLIFLACHLDQPNSAEAYLNLSKLTDTLGDYDSVLITLEDLEGHAIGPAFHLEKDALGSLAELAVPYYKGQKVRISIIGYFANKVVYDATRIYEGNQNKIESVTYQTLRESKVLITPSDTQLYVGDSAIFPKAIITPSALTGTLLEWTSLNLDFLETNLTHYFAKKPGTAELRVRLKYDTIKQFVFVVRISNKTPFKQMESVTLSPKNMQVAVGGAHKFLTAVVLPSTYKGNLIWKSEDSSRATVTQDGEVAGLQKGIVKIWTTGIEDATKSDTALIEVVELIKVTQIKFLVHSLDLYLGSGAAIPEVKAYPPEANQFTNLMVGDSSVVRIAGGRLEGLKLASTYLVVKSNENSLITDTIFLSVKKLEVISGVVIEKDTINLYQGGDSPIIKAVIFPVTSSQTVRWKTSDPLVAAIDSSSGKISPKVPGRTYASAISTLDSTKHDSSLVLVRKDTPQLNVGRSDTTVSVGTTITFHPVAPQAFGKILIFKWDLDGDNVYEGSSTDSVKSSLSFLYSKEKETDAHFFASDTEGNDTLVVKKIHAVSGPVILITSPLDKSYFSKTVVDVVWFIDGIKQTSQFLDTLLLEGANTITRKAKDGLGKDYSASVIVYLDRVPPKMPILQGTALVRNRTPTWSWKSGGGGIGSYRYRLDSSDMSLAIFSKDTAFAPESALSDGKHVLYVEEKDEANNWSPPGSYAITVDFTPPKAPIVQSALVYTKTAQPKWTWLSSGGGAGQFRFKMDDSVLTAQLESTDLSYTPNPLSESAHTLYVQERDDLGNWSESGKFTVYIDFTPPNQPVVTSIPKKLRPIWTWESGGANGSGNYRYKLDDAIVNLNPIETSSLTFTPNKDLSEGNHILYVQERDVAGNWSNTGSSTILAARPLNALTDNEIEEGYTLLFDGSRESFANNFVDYQQNVSDNIFLDTKWSADIGNYITMPGTGPDIRSKLQYRDFDLRLEYRNSGNQGIFYRFRVSQSLPWQTGVEFAIDNLVSTTLLKSNPGAAYDMFGHSQTVYNPFSLGLWNSVRIVAVGDSVEHWMNGVKLIGYKYHSATWWSAYNLSKWASFPSYCMKTPGDRGSGYIDEGYIGFEGDHGGAWQIRNLRINAVSPKIGPP